MSDDERDVVEAVSKVEGHAIVAVPVDKTQAVLEFVAGLEREDTDVSGYMISKGLFGGIAVGGLAATQPTDSGCRQTKIVNETDWQCVDTDTLTS